MWLLLLALIVGVDAFFLEPNRLVLREERLPLSGWEVCVARS